MIQKDGNNIILSSDPDKVIFAELENKKACKNYASCISGTFQYQNEANAILIYGGNVISNLSAHGWLGYPDTCLIYYKDGAFSVKRLVSIPAAGAVGHFWRGPSGHGITLLRRVMYDSKEMAKPTITLMCCAAPIIQLLA